jgi:hypothetical protein
MGLQSVGQLHSLELKLALLCESPLPECYPLLPLVLAPIVHT